MNSTKLIIGAIAVLAVVGLGGYMLTGTGSSNSLENPRVADSPKLDVQKNDQAGPDRNSVAGSFESYSPEKISFAKQGKVVLFFDASWCPYCRDLRADINENLTSIPAGLTILDVDYDNSTALKQKYGVTYQHTLVQVDASGNQIAKWAGSPTLAALVTNIK